MGTLTYFPTERFGAVTRSTEQPHLVERIAGWIRKSAHIRASASLGCETTLELAPNIVPIRRLRDLTPVEQSVELYCKDIGLTPKEIVRCTTFARNARRSGDSEATAVQAGKRLAATIAWGLPTYPVGRGPKDAA